MIRPRTLLNELVPSSLVLFHFLQPSEVSILVYNMNLVENVHAKIAMLGRLISFKTPSRPWPFEVGTVHIGTGVSTGWTENKLPHVSNSFVLQDALLFLRIAGLQLSITDRSSVLDVRQRNVKFMFIGVVDGSEISQIS